MISVNDSVQRLSFDVGEVQLLLNVFVNLTNDRSVQTVTNISENNQQILETTVLVRHRSIN